MSTANSLPPASRGIDSSSSSLLSFAPCPVPLPASTLAASPGLGLCLGLGLELVLVSLLLSASFLPSASAAALLAASFLASCLAFSAASSSFAACKYQPESVFFLNCTRKVFVTFYHEIFSLNHSVDNAYKQIKWRTSNIIVLFDGLASKPVISSQWILTIESITLQCYDLRC